MTALPDSRRRLSPSSASIPVADKARESWRLARNYIERTREGVDFAWVFEDFSEYDELLRAHGPAPLADAKTFEIGYGARPYRLIALQSMGVDASGVDAEVPFLSAGMRETRRALRTNGLERTAKSLVRRAVFDPSERKAYRTELARHGLVGTPDPSRMLVGDGADVNLPDGGMDLVISEEVFQSVERASLERMVPAMARWLKPGGLALIRPTVYTGILGAVLQEWSKWTLAHPPKTRRTEPWGHLRGHDIRANTHVNRFTRADYRELFSQHFEIVEERVRFADLGREYMTPEIRAELAAYPDEELFSNMVLFVLRKRS